LFRARARASPHIDDAAGVARDLRSNKLFGVLPDAIGQLSTLTQL
jgi:hypothetical protein